MQEDIEIKQRKKYNTKKGKELENLLAAAKDFEFRAKTEFVETAKSQHDIAELTKKSCMYPSRYLNDDNTCVNCHLFEHCACSIKNLGKKKRNEG